MIRATLANLNATPWRFALRAMLFFALNGSFAGYLAMSGPRDNNNYLGAIADKHARLDAVAAPRIVFVGGSNLALGLDSPTIERATGLPVVNLGLHAGLGLEFMLCEATGALKPGDTAVLSLEWEHFAFDSTSDVLPMALAFRPRLLCDLPYRLDKWVIDRAHVYIGRSIRAGLDHFMRQPEPTFDPPYSRDSFNPWGDVTAHRNLPQLPSAVTARVAGYQEQRINQSRFDAACGLILQFHQRCASKGVRVLYTFPATSEENIRLSGTHIRNVARRLGEPGMPLLLDSPESAALPTSCFFDSAYHLSGEGVRLRSERVAAELKTALNSAAK